jgi:hypothetical protein
MTKKIDAEEPKKSPEEAELVKRIDQMMDPNASAQAAETSASKPDVAAQPEIDIFKEMKTAPEVSPTLLKKAGVAKSSTKNKEPEIAESNNAPEPEAAKAAAQTTAPPIVKHEAKTITPLAQTEPPEAAETPEADQVAPEEPIDIKDQDPYADNKTDEAVDDIVATEADEILAAEDILKQTASEPVAVKKQPKVKRSHKLNLGWLKSKKGLAILAVALVLLVALIPASRYAALGMVVKKQVTIRVLDNKTATPVSNAKVSMGGGTATTNAKGIATLKTKPGKQMLTIEKQYYSPYMSKQFVGLNQLTNVEAKLLATGRQVPITVVDKVSGLPVAGAEVRILKTSAKTDGKGKATIVLPANIGSSQGEIAASGFNTLKATVKVTDSVVPENTFMVTPKGKIYFLSNQNGTIDVVSTNLDGTERKVVLAGTGKEDARTTSLLASRDWRYVALKAKRDTAQPALYVIDTATNKVRQFDSGVAEYELVGWSGHDFIYDVVLTSKSRWQPGREVLKSYDAERGDLNQLDQSQAEGDANTYAYQSFYNFYIVEDAVTYTTQWTVSGATDTYDLGNKTASIRAVGPTGQGKKDYQTFAANTYPYFQAALFEPQAIYYAVGNSTDGKTLYYEFEDKKVSQKNDIDAGAFNRVYPTYLISPNGKQSFWTELRDGKDSLLLGDNRAANKKVIATLPEYAPYGWHSDKYVLVSKNGSELYILPANGLTNGKTPLKITDYYKPSQSLTGYGYGYGGL